MLIVFGGAPSSAPTETMLYEQAIAEVVGGKRIARALGAVCPLGGRGWLNDALALTNFYARIVERIYVYSHAIAVAR